MTLNYSQIFISQQVKTWEMESLQELLSQGGIPNQILNILIIIFLTKEQKLLWTVHSQDLAEGNEGSELPVLSDAKPIQRVTIPG